MKKILLLLSVFIAAISGASAQKVYLADTAFTTDIGFGGAPASCRAPHLEYFGWQMGRAQSSWLADAFTVPADSTWTFDTVVVYGYQRNSGTTSTFLNCNLQIYSGTPGLGGAVIWGDTVTNVLAGTGFTGIYRVDTVTADGGLTSVQRPIMYLKLHLSPAPSLTAGTYWLSWSSAGSGSYIPDAPDKVLSGRINPPGQMARQFYGGVWEYISDSGQTIGMDKIIKASAALAVPALSAAPNFSLAQNVPNPFNVNTTISFYMPQSGNASLYIYNAIGQCVAKLVDGKMNTGDHHIVFNAETLPAGMYYYRLNTPFGTESKQMLLEK